MFKKLLPLFVLLFSTFLAKAQLPCNAVAFAHTQVGNTVTFVSTVPPGFQVNAYSWTFGDGGTSNIANPVHTYSNFGIYNACLVVSGIYNNTMYTCTFCDSILIPNNAPCSATFTYTTSGATATFTNTATGPGVITNYAWNFGDGNNSNLPNPTHTYATTGWYNVCLTIYGVDNGLTYTCNWCDSVYVNVQPAPCNGVGYNTTQVGNTVTFNPVVPAGYIINTYFWTFGDGGNSNLANPSHTYANNGSYNACLVISGTYPPNGIFQCTYCDTINIGNNVPCNASFIYTTSGNTVAFTNTATGPGIITGYSWTFGDGGTSLLPNPTHTYANNGTYNVCLTITGIYNNVAYTCSWCDSVTVGVNINPCNSIYYTTTQVANSVTFNVSVPAGFVANTYAWTFGDGGTSNLANPTHLYANNGWYMACVVISGTYMNNFVTCTYCDSIFVGNNIQPCSATFTYTTSGATVNFTNTATGPGVITNYAWNFGDGNNSNLPNPSHTYATTGWYNVCLTIYGVDSGITYTCTWCDSVYVIVQPAPCNGVGFNTTQVGNSVTFNAFVPAGYVINTYFWTFGDGGNSNLANPTHTYANNGSYNACLVISGTYPPNGIFQCSVCDTIYIANNVPCSATFIYTTSGLTASFTNTATGPGVITNYAWNFGDGNNSNLPNPVHTYATTGWYNVCLTIYGINNGLTYTCTWCDSIYVVGGGNPCNGISFNTVQTGNIATFNAIVPAGYTISTYFWTFGDGGNSNVASPVHTYANNGWYNVCMVISGTTNLNTPFQCSVCDSIYVSASGVHDIENGNSFNVYPNPSNHYIEIPLFGKNNYQLKLIDVAGKIIREIKLDGSDEKYILNTENLSKGMYFIQLNAGHKNYHSNFIKQ